MFLCKNRLRCSREQALQNLANSSTFDNTSAFFRCENAPWRSLSVQPGTTSWTLGRSAHSTRLPLAGAPLQASCAATRRPRRRVSRPRNQFPDVFKFDFNIWGMRKYTNITLAGLSLSVSKPRFAHAKLNSFCTVCFSYLQDLCTFA